MNTSLRRRLTAGLAGIALACLVGAPAVRAQVTSADVVGHVTDASGAALPGTTVTITNTGTGAVRTVSTNEPGDYVFSSLPIGRYVLRVELSGFTPFQVNLTLAAGDRQRVEAALKMGGLTESVEVTAAPTLVQSDTATMSALVPEKAVQDLPLNGRNIVGLLRLVPGASEGLPNSLSTGNRPDDRRPSATVSVNGQNDVVNNNLIDGVDNNERFIGTPAVRPSVDAIAEVKVQTNMYTAEVGRTAGGVINILTKSGANDFHGSAYAFGRHETFDAKNFFAPKTRPKPKFRQYQGGFSLGGPIKHNQTFFFVDYEHFHQDQGLTFVSTVPTAKMRNGDFSELSRTIYDPLTSPRVAFPGNIIPAGRIDPAGRNVLNLYPLPTSPGLSNNYTTSRDRTQDSDTLDVRIDHQFDASQHLYARYSFNAADTFVPGVFDPVNGIESGGGQGGFAGPSTARAHGIHLNYLNIFSQNFLLEVKGAYFHFTNNSLPLNFGSNIATTLGIPGINVDANTSAMPQWAVAGYTLLGDARFIPIFLTNDAIQFQATATKTQGAHSFKFGAGAIYRIMTPYQSNDPAGLYSFTAQLTDNGAGSGGDAAAALLLGYPQQVSRSNLLVETKLHTWEPNLFFQDDWRATKWLTVNLGLRWDLYTPFTESENEIANIDVKTLEVQVAGQNGVSRTGNVKTDYKDFAPRIGFAATVRPGFVVRGGYGIAYFPSQVASNGVLRNPPFVFPYGPVVSTGASGGLPSLVLSAGLPPPRTPSLSPLTGAYVAVDPNLKSSYLHQFNLLVEKEVWGNVASLGYVGSRGHRLWLPIGNLNLAPPGPGAINPRRPFFSVAPGLASLGILESSGFQNYNALQASFLRRSSRGLTLGANYTWAHGTSDTTQPGGGAQTGQAYGVLPYDVHNVERGASDIDIRHKFAFFANYELPFGKSSTGVKKQLVANWQVNVIAFYQSGVPFTVVNATPRSNTGVGANGDRPNRVCSGALDNPTIAKWFDTSCFVPQALNTAGNSGRNILYGPPQRRLDLSVFKDFTIGSGRLQFRAECFNLTNTPSFSVPNASLGPATFGTITTTANAIPRQFQFALKFLF